MDNKIKTEFCNRWKLYFGDADLPICFFYTDNEEVQLASSPKKRQCFIGVLAKVRRGESLRFNGDNVTCLGGKRYLGFSNKMMPYFEHFLSCGITGKIEGERYKKSPELVKELMKHMPFFEAPARYIVFKRWDMLDDKDEPEVVIFFAKTDVLSALFTLANFDETEHFSVIAPFAAGCSSIVMYPYLENRSKRPRAVLGMFDVTARAFVPKDILTFAVPMNKFTRMVENMDESFLITTSWAKIKKRINRA